MNFSKTVLRKIEKYEPKGGIDQTAKFFLVLCGVKHQPVKEHVERVALLAEKVAERTNRDKKAAFFAGLFHDLGKMLLDYRLFDGHNIDAEEYEEVKKHAIVAFEALRELRHLFVSFCAGIHHAMYKAGYGLTIKDFPKNWSLATIKKLLEISAIVSICDFIDAYSHRSTKIKDGSDKAGSDLKSMLKAKYPDDHQIIEIALEENEKLLAVAV